MSTPEPLAQGHFVIRMAPEQPFEKGSDTDRGSPLTAGL